MELSLILCPIDFSEFSAMAYRHALSVAEHYHAKVVALHVVELRKYPFADYVGYEADFAKLCRALVEGGEVKLRDFVQKYSDERLQPQLVVDCGNASDYILSFAQNHNVELMVMGTHGRRGFDRLVLGSTADRVMRKACCPVLVISKQPHGSLATEDRHAHHLSRILYCTDFSENSERALSYAISTTDEYDAELTLLHVIERALGLTKKDELTAICTKKLDALIASETRKRLKTKTVVRLGTPYKEVVQFASEMRIDMIVMAARGAEALDRAVFGSTTYRVIQLGPCPVLVIHT
jgi:nucleotide-binding universal stress UspA family protein